MVTRLILTGLMSFLIAAGCSDPRQESSPRMIAMLTVAYSQVGAAGPLFELLHPEDRLILEQEAARASALGATVAPQDLLMIRVLPRDVSTSEPEVKTLEQDADNLYLEVAFGDRSKFAVHLRKSQGKWRLKLPVSVKP